MFKPARMKKLRIITLDKYADSAVSSLHEAGLVQIEDISERIQQDAEWRQILKPSSTSPFTGKISSLLMKTSGTVDFLKSMSRKEKGILPLVKGFISPPPIKKVEVEALDTQELIQKAEKILGEVESKTKPLEEKINQLDSRKTELENALRVARNLSNFNVDLGLLEESDYVSVIAGKLSLESYDKFMGNLKDLTDEIVVFDQDSESKGFKILVVVTVNKHAEEVLSQLRKMEFERFEFLGLSGKPDELIGKSQSELESIAREKESILNQLADISAEWFEELRALKEELEIEKQRNEVFSSFGETEKTVLFEGWVPEKKLKNALLTIDTSTEGHSIVDVTDPDVEKDEIPVQLDNPKFAKPYEMFVHMYSPPNYREVDPTILMAIVFPFFFGFCLTEAGYGIADALIGYIIFRGLGRNSKTMANMGLIMIACGVWAVILGLVTNSFIGDFFPRFIWGDTAMALPTTIPSINSFAHPENILIIAILVGVIHLNLGLAIGAYNNIVRGDMKEALGAQIVWFILEAGVVLLALGYLLLGGGILMYAGIGVLVLSLIMLVYFNGMFGIMDVSGFLGNVLSYARLLALCLSTGGIAMTVNILTGICAEMIPLIGIIIAPIVFVGGQIANLAFQTLGAFINALRLHYVEFFAQFYIGGSQKFKAFRAKRKFTNIGGK
ncbi:MULTISPECIES: V-type ATP synthase subunit I [Methanobacterium]|jgi:V/A-type H+-transporting ATPase subunit I|uniref:A-type ATP synthase subunit I n=2 Tax=Methanobacterium formicicum TaxID=2162 RepID=A0A089ZFC8_METFO|nr:MULTISPECIES: V-type ATP synthase subunit I [Methanobacterium]AIS31650.1 A1A0 archaeal ATP synthase subunit I AhaI [Methanobacterium formicicum]MBF4475869.1 V-type ATP synthase subunit I [Methanobacterium formicicum]MDG3548076.1 V-type ATP synthase subunit I [Methanobacterium formicicum]MDH2660318.1 V-type ATP synthase subunit I [Methanobacterium formicicum]